jgi:hypothetical protein
VDGAPAETTLLLDDLERELRQAAFLDRDLESASPTNLYRFWEAVYETAHIPRSQSFIGVVDVGVVQKSKLGGLADLLSSSRGLEAGFAHGNPRVGHIFVGTWDHLALEDIYRGRGTSFPYTPASNYRVWCGVDMDAFEQIALSRGWDGVDQSVIQLLHELVGGNPSVAGAVLDSMPHEEVSFDLVLEQIERVAMESSIVLDLLEEWRETSSVLEAGLHSLLRYGALPLSQLQSEEAVCLSGHGLAETIDRPRSQFLRLQSWFTELVLRFHYRELGFGGWEEAIGDVSDRVVPAQALNDSAYKMLNEVENLLRNALTQFLKENKSGELFAGMATRYDRESGVTTDARERARAWKDRRAQGAPWDHRNPLVAYTSTRELGDLIQEAGRTYGSTPLIRIGKELRDVAEVRDAVMHNQMITHSALSRIEQFHANVVKGLVEAF